MWTAILLACVSQVCFAVAGLLQKWLMNKSKITPVQLTLWTSLGAVFCTLVYYSLIVRRPEEIMFIDNFKYAPVFVLGIIVLSLLGIQCGLFASITGKHISRPYTRTYNPTLEKTKLIILKILLVPVNVNSEGVPVPILF